MNLTQEERDSVLFYQGATSAISPKPESLQAFYAIPNIYELMNTFLFPGCANERARFLMEHRTVNLTAINHMSELLLVYKQLYQAMCKQTSPAVTRTYHTCRKDRINTLIYLKAGTFPSFCSTSTSANISPAYRKKAGLLLLELLVPNTVPHLNFQKVFGAANTKPDEQEILFPPFLTARLQERRLTPKEAAFRDCNGEPPKAKYLIRLAEPTNRPLRPVTTDRILDPNRLNTVKQVLNTFQQGQTPTPEQETTYVQWKDDLQVYLAAQFQNLRGVFQTKP